MPIGKNLSRDFHSGGLGEIFFAEAVCVVVLLSQIFPGVPRTHTHTHPVNLNIMILEKKDTQRRISRQEGDFYHTSSPPSFSKKKTNLSLSELLSPPPPFPPPPPPQLFRPLPPSLPPSPPGPSLPFIARRSYPNNFPPLQAPVPAQVYQRPRQR